MIAAHTTANLVNLTFQFGLRNALNFPVVLSVMVGGLLAGALIQVSLHNAGTPVSARMVAVLTATTMATLQVASTFGSSIYAPNNSAAFVGGHIGYVVLSVLFGLLCGVGVRAVQLARRPQSAHVANLQQG